MLSNRIFDRTPEEICDDADLEEEAEVNFIKPHFFLDFFFVFFAILVGVGAAIA